MIENKYYVIPFPPTGTGIEEKPFDTLQEAMEESGMVFRSFMYVIKTTIIKNEKTVMVLRENPMKPPVEKKKSVYRKILGQAKKNWRSWG